MTDWKRIVQDDYLVGDLAEMLRSPDPVVRDEFGYSVLATWIGRGVLDEARLRALGNEMAGRFGDGEIQARTFAPLILDCIVTAGVLDPSWVDPFESWYGAEADLRGYGEKLGWLHAVAHGADLLGTFGSRAEVDAVRMLELAARRMLAPTGYVWRDMEDDRLGHAIALVLARADLTAEAATGWLALVAEVFRAAAPGPMPPYASNTVRTLRVVYLLTDRGLRRSRADDVVQIGRRDEVLTALAGTLRLVEPRLG